MEDLNGRILFPSLDVPSGKITIFSLLHLKLTKEPFSDSYTALGLSDYEAKYNDFA